MQLKKSQVKLNPILYKQLLNSLNRSTTDRSSGFTLIEVMVSIIMLAAFMSVTMSALVTATLVKIQAKGATVVANWIEEDLESARSKANSITYTAFNSSSFANTYDRCNGTYYNGSKNASTSVDSGYAAAVWDQLKNDYSVTSNTTQADGSKIYTQTVGTKSAGSKTYTLTRTTKLIATFPYEVLQLTYTATESGSQTASTKMYTEVIPNAALQCPKY